MLTRQQKIDKIKEVIGQDRNVGNEYEGDFWIREVMIGDVLDWIEKNIEGDSLSRREGTRIHDLFGEGSPGNQYFDLTKREEKVLSVNLLRSKKREKIDNQSDNCIDYIYSLLESDNSLCKSEDK